MLGLHHFGDGGIQFRFDRRVLRGEIEQWDFHVLMRQLRAALDTLAHLW